MPKQPARNVLFILSDEHQRDITGCYGNDVIATPNIDRLAARGARFTAAYTPCPICVPARAALATGRWVHQTRCWDNAHPYSGDLPSWHHRLSQAGHRVASIGKLHFRETGVNGFTEEILPLHVLNGLGDLLGTIRNPPAARGNMPSLARDTGPGESSYNDYDRDIAAASEAWLAERGRERREGRAGDKPWVLFVSFVRPHFPLIAPPEFYDKYSPERMPLPRLYDRRDKPLHPVLQALRDCMNYDDYFDEVALRRAIASYYALVAYLDHNIGRVVAALEAAGLADDTRIVYTSDHGDNLGTRGLWGKSVMYEESAAVPFVAAGPEIPHGVVIDTPVSLVDIHRSILDAAGVAPHPDDADLPSQSIWPIIAGERPDRNVLGEYHAAASITGTFMIRHGRWKYIHHAGYAPELFDLDADPGEERDLAGDPGAAAALAECEARLRAICDPDAVNAEAFADQRRTIDRHGGEAAILKRGDFGYTPAPGEKARFA